MKTIELIETTVVGTLIGMILVWSATMLKPMSEVKGNVESIVLSINHIK